MLREHDSAGRVPEGRKTGGPPGARRYPRWETCRGKVECSARLLRVRLATLDVVRSVARDGARGIARRGARCLEVIVRLLVGALAQRQHVLIQALGGAKPLGVPLA